MGDVWRRNEILMDLDMARAQLEYEIPDDDTNAEGHRVLLDLWMQLDMLTGELHALWTPEGEREEGGGRDEHSS